MAEENLRLKQAHRQELSVLKGHIERQSRVQNHTEDPRRKHRGHSHHLSNGQTSNSILTQNKELLRIIEDKSLLERQVDEYKSTLMSQTKLIQSLQKMLHQKHA